MTIGVGEILDKYELLEMVGQGGMAMVYRGFDRSLRREVAVKVLHSHLAESVEARNRFEREAHAVAKLRHDNILEIFDFSGIESHESYIVTEFIDGPTLKQFVTTHSVQYPEIGALITVQVCRALGHAHSLGILHRDVKPENIMIRQDGVVKLTDFGIAQMIDLQRMTVTGQLLGSPAYMSPEHVEGEPLDFRTDMFSVGILLYQLTTGELPFKGRSPHEILKRIADCNYEPPGQLNPLIGKELSTIISTALARSKDDRYTDIGQMLEVLETYLEGSGLDEAHSELQRFFAAPSTYQMALRERMLDHLGRRGTKMMSEGSAIMRVRALEVFNRVLTIDPDNKPVLDAIDRISRRRRGMRLAAIVAGIVVLAALIWAGSALFGSDAGRSAAAVPSDAAPSDAAVVAVVPPDATLPRSQPADAAVTDAGIADARKRVVINNNHRRPRKKVDAAVIGPTTRDLRLSVFPRKSEFRIGQGTWLPITGQLATVAIDVDKVQIEVRNTRCCANKTLSIGPGTTATSRKLSLQFLPGSVKPVCNAAGVRVTINGQKARLGKAVVIPIGGAGSQTVRVSFWTKNKTDDQTAKVGYKKQTEVRCALK